MQKLMVEIRESLGMKKGEFATALDVDAGAISKWEQGLRTPSTEIVGKLLRISQPEQQGKILKAIGATDNALQFATAILESHGILVINANQLTDELAQMLAALPMFNCKGAVTVTSVPDNGAGEGNGR